MDAEKKDPGNERKIDTEKKKREKKKEAGNERRIEDDMRS